MPNNRSGTTRRRRPVASAVGMLVAAFALIFSLPGMAQAAPDSGQAHHIKRGHAWMGMSIAKHDQSDGSMPAHQSLSASVQGVDVSGWQGNVDWNGLWNSGVRWAYVKATEGRYYQNDYFYQQYVGSYNVGMIRGSYHFAIPNKSSGAAQANYFVDHGGGWSRDGKTLPGALDIEYNPYGATCYGLSQASMRNWIADFVNTYRSRTGRDAVIYSTTNWWSQCTGNWSGLGNTDPLWIARYASSPGTLPAGWGFYTMWQYTSTGSIVGDHDVFNGAYDRLQALANG